MCKLALIILNIISVKSVSFCCGPSQHFSLCAVSLSLRVPFSMELSNSGLGQCVDSQPSSQLKKKKKKVGSS